jgi:Fe-coproporphyrin III synthase
MDTGSTLQLHPLGRCNLSCRHCYSASSPHVTGELPVDMLVGAITDAAAEGYRAIAVSGGEPLLYRGLPRLIERAHEVGMVTAVTTNGTLLDPRRAAMLRDVDLLAISLDGVPASHDRMRGDGSFARMARRLDGLRASGIRFGFLFTLTMHNVDELEWVAGFALAQGAALLQVHPLELAGNARSMTAERPDSDELQWAVIEAARVQECVGAALTIHLDVLPAGNLRDLGEHHCRSLPFAAVLQTLVVESSGTVAPLEHGFDRRWTLGSLHEAPLSACIDRFRVERLSDFKEQVIEAAVADAVAAGRRFVNWHETVARRAGGYALPAA